MVSLIDHYNVTVSLQAEEQLEANKVFKDPEKSRNPKTPVESEESSSEDEIRKFTYKCSFCKESFKRKDRLDRHLFKHTGKKSFTCEVDGCTKEYTNKSHLNRHMKSVHMAKPDNPSITCKHENCNEIFTNQSNMSRHYQSHHANPLPYQCGQCVHKFRRKIQLKKHEIQKHTGRYPYYCPHCQKGFLNTFTYSRHVSTHKTELAVRPCPDCSAQFSKWSQLVDHRRKFHKKTLNFTCDICQKTFSRKPNIKAHMKLHMTATDDVFQCHYENCPKFYNAKRNLMSHIRSKHEGKKWTCDFCESALSTRQKLQQHISAHLDASRAMNLPKKVSTLSQLIGRNLPQSEELKIIRGETPNIELPEMESTHDTSATELSDY